MIYWSLVYLDATGNRKSEEISQAREFFTTAFSPTPHTPDLADTLIQRQLFNCFRGDALDSNTVSRYLAELCLRCFISHQIESSCIQLEQNFGKNHGFTRHDLFPFVLNDFILNHPPNSSSYTALAQEILQTFNPEKGKLVTWTINLVWHHRELKAFLLEHGAYLVSDWAILNDTNSKQLQRILLEFYHRTSIEVDRAVNLLEKYHAIYRLQRLAQRQAGTRGQCPEPTDEQLSQIAQSLNLKPCMPTRIC